MAGLENANTSYPRVAKIFDKSLRISSLSSSRITLILVTYFISFLSILPIS